MKYYILSFQHDNTLGSGIDTSMASSQCHPSGGFKQALIKCVGPDYCAAIHEGVVSNPSGGTMLAPIMTAEGKETRDQLNKCATTGGPAIFHPACLDRDPAGAHARQLCSSNKSKTTFTHRDQTHILCDGCLTVWKAQGGQIGAHAQKGEINYHSPETHLDCDNHPND